MYFFIFFILNIHPCETNSFQNLKSTISFFYHSLLLYETDIIDISIFPSLPGLPHKYPIPGDTTENLTLISWIFRYFHQKKLSWMIRKKIKKDFFLVFKFAFFTFLYPGYRQIFWKERTEELFYPQHVSYIRW